MNPAPSFDEVNAIVREETKKIIEDLTDEMIEKAERLDDIGMTSIDVVEIVTVSMRRLKIQVPRGELIMCASLAEIVNLLHRHAVIAAEKPVEIPAENPVAQPPEAAPENPPTTPPAPPSA